MKYFTAVVSFLVPLTGAATPLGLAPLFAFAAFIQIVWLRWRDGVWPRFEGLVSIVLLIFAVWSAVTLIWSPDVENAAEKLARLLVLVALGLVYIRYSRVGGNERALSIALLAGTALAIILIFIEKFAGAPLYRLIVGDIPTDNWDMFLNRFNRGMTVICLVAWPAARAASKFHLLAGIGLLFAAALLSMYMNSAAALVALIVGAICFAFVWLFPARKVVSILGVMAAAVILFMPAVVDQVPDKYKSSAIRTSLPTSAYHRLLIWKFAKDRIDERPVLGWGFYSSRAIPGGTEKVDGNLPALPLHPHNMALQWRLELGLPGAILGSVLLFVLFRTMRAYTDRADRATAAATAASGLTIALLSYGIWQSWWVAALLFSVACLPSLPGRRQFPRT